MEKSLSKKYYNINISLFWKKRETEKRIFRRNIRLLYDPLSEFQNNRILNDQYHSIIRFLILRNLIIPFNWSFKSTPPNLILHHIHNFSHSKFDKSNIVIPKIVHVLQSKIARSAKSKILRFARMKNDLSSFLANIRFKMCCFMLKLCWKLGL